MWNSNFESMGFSIHLKCNIQKKLHINKYSEIQEKLISNKINNNLFIIKQYMIWVPNSHYFHGIVLIFENKLLLY